MSKNTHDIPKAVSAAAKRGLEMAHKLADSGKLSTNDALHVSKYFPRHAGDNLDQDGSDGQRPSNGYIAWLLWGGDAGREWNEAIKRELEGKNS